MDIKWLQTFVAAAQYENYRRAAEKLFLAQPTVTVHIKNLEKELGLSLFERKGRHVVLTSAGHRFLTYAQGIIEKYERGIHDMESWRQGYQHKLTLAVSPLVAASLLPTLIRKFIAQHPDIEIAVNVMESKKIGDTVIQGTADIGLSRMNIIQPFLQVIKLFDDPIVLVAPHDGGDLEHVPALDFEQVIRGNMIFTHNHPEYWPDLLREIRQRYSRIRTMAVSQVHVTKGFIEEGLGVSFLPRSTIQREVLEGRVLEVSDDKIKLPIASTYLLYKSDSRVVRLFNDYLIGFYTMKAK